MLHSRLLIVYSLFVWSSNAATTSAPISTESSQVFHSNPQSITIKRFENLLRRAGELFRPHYQPVETAVATDAADYVPYDQMQPPTDQPYNFYLPVFQYDNEKLDVKSKQMEKIRPPPVDTSNQYNYYTTKPRKTPKKFTTGTKLVNVKIGYYGGKSSDSEAQQSPSAYMENDQSRINFDDSFFAVAVPDNVPQDHRSATDVVPIYSRSFLNRGEEQPDLLAADSVSYNRYNVKIEMPSQKFK